MSYRLDFLPVALKEWKKLGPTVREQFKKKLAERLVNPHVPSARLNGAENLYKIKLRGVGYRLAYQVDDGVLVVLVLAVGKRDKGGIYSDMLDRL